MTTIYVICFSHLLHFLNRLRSFRYRVTPTDYSLVVRNPPPDAYDPDEWNAFFSQFADKQVTAVTIALDNEEMIHKLIARRYHLRNLRFMLPKGIDLEDEDVARTAVAQLLIEQAAEPQGCFSKLLGCTVVPILNIFGMVLPADKLVDNAFRLKKEIKELQKKTYNVCSVFVTFETEEGQRAALTALSNSKLDIMTNSKANVAPSAVFRGNLLRVHEATDPSSVRWLDLSAGTWSKVFIRILNFVITIAGCAFAGWAVNQTRASLGPGFSGPLVSIFNSIIPVVIKLLMIFERHPT